MKSRSSKSSTGGSKQRKGLSPTAKVVGATTIGALAGGLVGTAIARRKRPNSALGKAARKLKGWAKSAANSPAMKSWVQGVAQQVVESRLSARPIRKVQSGAAPSGMGKGANKVRRKK